MKSRIYYFSGTGNALHCAEWFSQEIVKNSSEAELVNIEKLENRRVEDIGDCDLIGFCSPTHGFNYPPLMLNFIFNFPAGNGQKIFLMNTRAGMKIGKYMIPGLSGVALLLAAIVLKMKGYRIAGMRSVDLPSNWTSFHWSLKDSKVDSLYDRREGEVRGFARKIVGGGRDLNSLKDIVQDLIIAPVSIGYYVIGRFLLSKTLIASRDCNSCNICIEKCPVSAIKEVDSRPYWTWKCESCMRCMNICPQRSIEAAHGFVVIFIVLFNILFIKGLDNLMVYSGASGIVKTVLNNFLFIAGMFGGYAVLHRLMRFNWIERLVTGTSISRFRFWKRYKAPK